VCGGRGKFGEDESFRRAVCYYRVYKDSSHVSVRTLSVDRIGLVSRSDQLKSSIGMYVNAAVNL
jgi:hypothetical protein